MTHNGVEKLHMCLYRPNVISIQKLNSTRLPLDSFKKTAKDKILPKTHMMINEANTLWEKSNICCFTPYAQI